MPNQVGPPSLKATDRNEAWPLGITVVRAKPDTTFLDLQNIVRHLISESMDTRELGMFRTVGLTVQPNTQLRPHTRLRRRSATFVGTATRGSCRPVPPRACQTGRRPR